MSGKLLDVMSPWGTNSRLPIFCFCLFQHWSQKEIYTLNTHFI